LEAQQQQQQQQLWQQQQLQHKECALERWQNANGAKTMQKRNRKPAERKGNSPLRIKPQSQERIFIFKSNFLHSMVGKYSSH